MTLMSKPFMRTGREMFGIDRYDPALALYLPLWYKGLQGSPIVSLDINRHLCTVTGGVFGKYGWTVDGDDYITLPVVITSAMWQESADFSVVIWAKTTAFTTTNQALIALGQAIDSSTYAFISLRTITYLATSRNRFVIGRRDNTNKENDRWITDNNTNLSDNTLYCFGLAQASGVLSFYINGASVGIANDLVGAINGASFANSKTMLGATSTDVVEVIGNYLTGLEGEGLVFSKALTAANFLQIYQRTKWRS